ELLTVDDVIDAALGGDPAMREVLADVGRVLARAIASTLCVTDSRLVLLCGPTLRAGDLLVDPLREALAGIAPFEPPEIRLGRLGTHAGPVGAAALVLTDLVRSDVTAPAAPPTATAPSTPTRTTPPTPTPAPSMSTTSSRSGTGAVAYAHP
ncbi:MAG TPA: ROK family protein, partial [Actinopolymorphaceae bacterium]